MLQHIKNHWLDNWPGYAYILLVAAGTLIKFAYLSIFN